MDYEIEYIPTPHNQDYAVDTLGNVWHIGTFENVRLAKRLNIGSYPKVMISIGGKKKTINIHKLVWETLNGPAPTGLVIDHIDRVKTNSAISNLRLLTPLQNSWNKDSINISYSRYGWYANITACGVTHKLGKFPTKEEARAAYLTAKSIYHVFPDGTPVYSEFVYQEIAGIKTSQMQCLKTLEDIKYEKELEKKEAIKFEKAKKRNDKKAKIAETKRIAKEIQNLEKEQRRIKRLEMSIERENVKRAKVEEALEEKHRLKRMENQRYRDPDIIEQCRNKWGSTPGFLPHLFRPFGDCQGIIRPLDNLSPVLIGPFAECVADGKQAG